MQKPFVAGAGLLAEIVGILEVHVDRAQAHDWARGLGAEAQRNAFFRLDVEHQLVRRQLFDRRIAEQDERRAAELNHDVRVARRQALAGAEVERNVRPSASCRSASFIATNVSVLESGATSGSARYAEHVAHRSSPSPYCPRTVLLQHFFRS